MAGILERPDASQIVSYAQDFTHPRWLGSLGHVTGVSYSYTCPGGCDQLAATLEISARERTDAMNPGRWVRVYRGASVVWFGKLDEPQPSAAGWQISAHGAGTFGADFASVYGSGAASPFKVTSPDDAVNQAITRGLQWVNSPGIGNPSGMWIGNPVDSGQQPITDMLNSICTKGGLTWYVACTPTGNVLSVMPLPTTVTNLLVCNSPVSRTLGGDVNTIFLRYQDRADGPTQAAEFSLTSWTDAASIAAHGAMETGTDLSSAAVLTAGSGPNPAPGTAKYVGQQVMKRYQRASFAGPFTVGPGQLLTTGGAPVDLGAGMPYAPMVVRLLLTDFGYGGELTPAPITFLVGAYSFDDDSQTATVTPFQSLDTSFSSLLSMVVATEPPRKAGT